MQESKSQLKRGRQSQGEELDPKKPRRSDRYLSPSEEHLKNGQLPTPLTNNKDSVATDEFSDNKSSPSKNTSSDQTKLSTERTRASGLSSPPFDTQPFSQFSYPPKGRTFAVDDEEGEGVWGYLVPLDGPTDEVLVLRRRNMCPVPGNKIGQSDGHDKVPAETFKNDEQEYEQEKVRKGVPAGGYLVGRHPECDRVVQSPTVSNRHCLLFTENQGGSVVAVLEDLSGNGTFVNDSLVGRNKRRVLKDGDEVSILDQARFSFRYPQYRNTNQFQQQFTVMEQLGKGHFASVYLCVEKCSGIRYAVKKFEKRTGPGEKSRVEGLQQEIAVLMGISHPALLCLKDTFNEDDGVYLVLELAPEGELFNWIVMKHKLTEAEARKVFIQLFQGVKYLHERNIVHRDIKPENILLVDKELHVKLADFGLAKIIGEESFTTTLCGTPSYVAPEILEPGNHRRYTRAVDVWSLGVVLYICLCGFPPFSDELYSEENPYTLSQQIKAGRFDYPSPYWDSVGDPALDLIDRMLTVEVEKRITIDECLEHPWVTQQDINPTDSTDGLTGAIANLDFSKRKIHRERTMLSSINDIKITRVIEGKSGQHAVKVYEKNPSEKEAKASKEETPAARRAPEEFMQMGGKGDEQLYSTIDGSRYPHEDLEVAADGEETKSNNSSGWRGRVAGPCVPDFNYGQGPTRKTSRSLLRSPPFLSCSLHAWGVMGLVSELSGPLAQFTEHRSLPTVIASGVASFIFVAVILNVLQQLLFKDPRAPPVVFHWFPIIGSTVVYGMDPYKFFFENRAKYGDVFTFILLGRKITVMLDTKGNNFILNGKLKDVNAEEIYSPLCTPVFGKDVVYDCPNSKLMEQKKFVKFGLTNEALRSYVKLITAEVENFLKTHKTFKGNKGTFNVPKVMAELTIYTASRSLQGEEVRNMFDSRFAELFHDLDMGFSPVNFMLSWAPLPHNRARDNAREAMIKLYSSIVEKRRSGEVKKDSQDMIWHLMDCKYKDGTPVPNHEIAGIMIALLMAGQHSSSSTIAWILLRLATKPQLIEELLEEQRRVLGTDLPPVTYDDLQKLPLHAQTVKETLRLHAPIHSIMRKVKQPMIVEGTNYVIPASHTLMSSPGVSAQMSEHFINPSVWDPHRWDEGNYDFEGKDANEEQIDYGWGVVSKGTNSPYLPFGAGRHRCIGEQFAYTQLQTILVAFVREFKLRNVGGGSEIIGTDYTSLFSRPLAPAIVEWERREKEL
ncbi:lanosterol 14-alpha-demethylase [Sporormia fimetaria CBS 119925]|uniref:Lanosterol 14-alpha-demethylase n=1 Tax=Sporormia fimetaria CBS 119925 TaxID=1340428 RepID=A0A6A6V4H3_9PLEO|nr:lanosterol 14-alpha-demethylase [Sporormia fimetaria CBS 119925]